MSAARRGAVQPRISPGLSGLTWGTVTVKVGTILGGTICEVEAASESAVMARGRCESSRGASASRSALSPCTAATNWIVPTTASLVGVVVTAAGAVELASTAISS